jgi:hypothetical protein
MRLDASCSLPFDEDLNWNGAVSNAEQFLHFLPPKHFVWTDRNAITPAQNLHYGNAMSCRQLSHLHLELRARRNRIDPPIVAKP